MIITVQTTCVINGEQYYYVCDVWLLFTMVSVVESMDNNTAHPIKPHKYTVTDIIIRQAILPDESQQIYKCINYAFRGKPIIDTNNQKTIIFSKQHTKIFHNLTERITLNEIQNTQQTNTNAVLIAVIPHNSTHYNNDSNNILVHDGILVGVIRCETLYSDDQSINDTKRNKYITPNGDSFEIAWFSVDPSYSGCGIGSILLHYAEQYGVTQLNCTQALLFMFRVRSELNKLYCDKYGYTDITVDDSTFEAPNAHDLLEPNRPIYWQVLQRTFASAVQYTLQYNDNTTFVMRKAKFTDVEKLTTVINWSYRGKPNITRWTCESEYIVTPRITVQGLTDVIQQSLLQINDTTVFVGIKQYTEAQSIDVLNDPSNCFISTTEQIVGCIQVTRIYDELCNKCQSMQFAACAHACEIGLYAVDPSESGKRYGKYLIQQAELYATNTLHCTIAVLHVLTVRADIAPMYTRSGYVDTMKRIAFPIPAENIRPAWRGKLEFAVYVKSLVT